MFLVNDGTIFRLFHIGIWTDRLTIHWGWLSSEMDHRVVQKSVGWPLRPWIIMLAHFIDFGTISTMQNIQSDCADAFWGWNGQNRVRSCWETLHATPLFQKIRWFFRAHFPVVLSYPYSVSFFQKYCPTEKILFRPLKRHIPSIFHHWYREHYTILDRVTHYLIAFG